MSLPRIGFGHDIHRLQEGGHLVMGNVVVGEGKSAVAHSDGDVVIHALVDALLGAIGQGDIGEIFPSSDARWKDADSALFLAEAVQRTRAAGYVIGNADIAILAEWPKLKDRKPAMQQRLQALLGAPVNVKAGTNEGCDAVGRGEAVAAYAVVLIVPADA